MALSKRRIKSKIGKLSKDLPIIVYKTIDSTNTQAKLAAESGKYTRAVFLAVKQTAGRGRLGRSFVSDGGKGLYMSILTTGGNITDGIGVTVYMAVIAARVIKRLTGLVVGIKWVNDLYAGGKKLAGILTEGRVNQGGVLDYSVCGIGINLLSHSFPEQIRDIATSVEDECGAKIDVNDVAGELISEFFANTSMIGTKEIADEYRSLSLVTGKRVTVIKADSTYTATVTDITDRCELDLLLDDGSREILSTGEVSVRL